MAKQSKIKLREMFMITFSICKKTRFFTSSEKTIGETGFCFNFSFQKVNIFQNLYDKIKNEFNHIDIYI